MKLQEYTKSKPVVTPRPPVLRTIRAYRTRTLGIFEPSVRLWKDLELSVGAKMIVARDNDSRNDWYVTFGASDMEGGLKIYQTSGVTRGKKWLNLRSSNKAAVNAILDSVGAEKSASFTVSIKPTMIDGKTWYRIMTANPVRIN